MDFLITNAYAEAAPAAGGGGMEGLFLLIAMVVVFYFLLIRPQTKRAKEHRNLVASLAKGDEVATNGGILGRITSVGESFVEIEICENVRIKVQKDAVMQLMLKGTMKTL